MNRVDRQIGPSTLLAYSRWRRKTNSKVKCLQSLNQMECLIRENREKKSLNVIKYIDRTDKIKQNKHSNWMILEIDIKIPVGVSSYATNFWSLYQLSRSAGDTMRVRRNDKKKCIQIYIINSRVECYQQQCQAFGKFDDIYLNAFSCYHSCINYVNISDHNFKVYDRWD